MKALHNSGHDNNNNNIKIIIIHVLRHFCHESANIIWTYAYCRETEHVQALEHVSVTTDIVETNVRNVLLDIMNIQRTKPTPTAEVSDRGVSSTF